MFARPARTVAAAELFFCFFSFGGTKEKKVKAP
jgi:hypothetical protein